MPCAYPYFLFMKKKSKSKYRIRKNELRKFLKEAPLLQMGGNHSLIYYV